MPEIKETFNKYFIENKVFLDFCSRVHKCHLGFCKSTHWPPVLDGCRLNLSCKCVLLHGVFPPKNLIKLNVSCWGMWSPIPCPYGSYLFTTTLSTCPLKAFEFKMPALCFILIQDNHILCVVIRTVIDLWEKKSHPGHKCTHGNAGCWEIFRPSESEGGPVLALIIHRWYFSTSPCRRWSLLLSTGGSGPSLLQKPHMPTLSLSLGIKGPGRWYLHSRAICLPLSRHLVGVNAHAQYLHRKELRPLWIMWCVYIAET